MPTPGGWGCPASEYVRRRLAQDAATQGSAVTVEDLARFADTFGDLADPDVMSQAVEVTELADRQICPDPPGRQPGRR